MHNYIIPANCWYHDQRCMISLSMRNNEHEVAFIKRDAGTDGRTVRKHNVPSVNDRAGHKKATWWPFWISNFSWYSFIWHVLILSNIFTQYENNRTHYLVITVINRQNRFFVIKSETLVAILSFQFSPNSFADSFSPIPTSVSSFKRNHQHLHLVKR